jgi:CRP-like cAMP-binding protein
MDLVLEVQPCGEQMKAWREGATLKKVTDLGPFTNSILKNLGIDTIGRLQLSKVQLEVRHSLEAPGEPIRDIFFLESGIASVTTQFKDGFVVEAGMYGSDSLSGISAFMGARASLNASYIQIAGHGFSCKIDRAAHEFDCGGEFRSFALRAVQAQFVQSMQSAGCNAHHDLEPRLARWLLLVADRTLTSRFALSHDFISTMLGARRSTVSIAAGSLKRRGLIEYTRSNIHILDRNGLEARACECYRVLRDYLSDYSQYDSGLARPAA